MNHKAHTPAGFVSPERRVRDCLRCKRRFTSTDFTNRLCKQCNGVNESHIRTMIREQKCSRKVNPSDD